MPLLGCGDRGSGGDSTSPSSSTEGALPAPTALEASADGLVVFVGGPLEIRNLKVKLGRAGASGDLDVRGDAVVTSTQAGRVEIPIKMACQAGSRRVMAVSKLITVAGERHNLEKARATEVYNQAPSRVGTARPDACELTFRIAPIGKAKENVQVLEETVCWTSGALKKGACEMALPEAPAAAHAVYDLATEVSASEIRIRGYYHAKSATVARGSVTAVATCGSAPPARGFELLKRADPFPLVAGESVPIDIEIERKPPASADAASGPCSVALSWNEWQMSDSAKPAEPTELGTWCVNDVKITPGACP